MVRAVGVVAALTVMLAPAVSAEDPSTRTAGMVKVRVVAEAEVLATSCGLRLNAQMRDTLLTEALALIDQSAFDSMEQFWRTLRLALSSGTDSRSAPTP